MTILYFIYAMIALGVLVFIHELGHYFVALKCGMKVEIFSIGFGKPLLKWKWKGVNWQLAALPFGGFVKIAGMEFGKKDEANNPTDPYQVEGGFFQMSPWKRIAVAVAGPLANFILALILLTVLFLMGGRNKPFSEFSHIIGWVDTKSELYALGVRPGDLLTEYDSKPYNTSKDLLYTGIQGAKTVDVKGFHVDYLTKTKTPFNYSVQNYPAMLAIDDFYTTGIISGAKYLIYDQETLPESSPMQASGLRAEDRLVWMDGQVLFSSDQLSHLLNDNRSFLTVKRGDKLLQTRQKRFLAGDLLLSSTLKNELIDWQFEGNVKGKWQTLYMLPYEMTAEGVIVEKIPTLEEDTHREAFPEYPYSVEQEGPLQAGDKIIAVDGTPVENSCDILANLQSRKVNMIVEHGVSSQRLDSWKVADKDFMQSIDVSCIDAIAKSIGQKNTVQESGPYALLKPVEPKRADQMGLGQEQEMLYAEQLKKVAKVKNPDKKARLMATMEENQRKMLLGIPLQDRFVVYNPNPIALFGSVFSETWWTLKALVSGYMNPKWLAGPIGIVQVIQHGWKTGITEALFWISAISVNLGFLNLLPIPILDGGYICLALWELITKRRLKAKTMERLIIPFVVLLIGLLIFLTFQDISRFF